MGLSSASPSTLRVGMSSPPPAARKLLMGAPSVPPGEAVPPNRDAPATERVGGAGTGPAAAADGGGRGGTTPTPGAPPRLSAVGGGCRSRPPPLVPPRPEGDTGVISMGVPMSPAPLAAIVRAPGRDPEPDAGPDTSSTPLVMVANASPPTEWVCTGTPSARRASASFIDGVELRPSPLVVGASSAPPPRRRKERLF